MKSFQPFGSTGLCFFYYSRFHRQNTTSFNFILPKRVGRNSVLLYLVHRLGPIPVVGNLLTNGAKSVTFLIQSRSLLRTRVVLNRKKDLTYKVDFCAQSGGQLLKLSKIYL